MKNTKACYVWKKVDQPERMSDEYFKLMSKCWNDDPNKRHTTQSSLMNLKELVLTKKLLYKAMDIF
ncbi:hypothetical protein ENUP19_0042G0051 [Entamoeba nuttalli]|uniref:Serine-threonine/tyrosine-protein kinase catalytic domain-containing protein n=1 Tax=Entamoeba nuttalli TaxID=412467 RepID=A0ABQ0DAT5_9EUKA